MELRPWTGRCPHCDRKLSQFGYGDLFTCENADCPDDIYARVVTSIRYVKGEKDEEGCSVPQCSV